MANLFDHVTPEEVARIKAGEEILYLLLLKYVSSKDNEEDVNEWKFVHGRQEVYGYIKNILVNEEENGKDSMILNIDESLIYADNPDIPDDKNKLRLSNGINIYKFMKDCVIRNKVVDDSGFDIEEFHECEIED